MTPEDRIISAIHDNREPADWRFDLLCMVAMVLIWIIWAIAEGKL